MPSLTGPDFGTKPSRSGKEEALQAGRKPTELSREERTYGSHHQDDRTDEQQHGPSGGAGSPTRHVAPTRQTHGGSLPTKRSAVHLRLPKQRRPPYCLSRRRPALLRGQAVAEVAVC